MGLFSSKYKTTVGTTVSRTIQDSTIISSVKTGVITGLFSDNSDQLVENIIESTINGLGIKAERMFSYAKHNYPYGLPSAKVSTTADGKSVVLGVIASLTNQNIEEDYYHFGPLNSLHAGWTTLFNSFGYKSNTNEISTLSNQIGYPVYLKDMVVVVKEDTLTIRAKGSLDLWGTAARAGYTPERKTISSSALKSMLPTPVRVAPDTINDYVEVTYVWEVPTVIVITPEVTTVVNGVSRITPAQTVIRNVIHEASMSILLSSFNAEQDYFHVKYINGNQEGYWLYQLGEGTYPEIDVIFNVTPIPEGQFFPVVYFRNGSKSMASDKESAIYKASKRMTKMLGINYLDIIDAIHQNPDIAQIEQAMMMFAVPANTTNQMEQRYLFDFFNKLNIAAGGVGVDPGWNISRILPTTEDSINFNTLPMQIAWGYLENKNKISNIRIEIADAVFNKALSCEGIFKRKKAGVIAAVGDYASSFTKETITGKYTTQERVYDNSGEDSSLINVEHTYSVPMDVFIYKHQVSDAVYEEIIVYDLKMTYYMWGGYSTVGNDLDAILLIPIDHAITKEYSIQDREELFARSLHYIFNSRVVTEVKWYQQGWFAALITVIAVVITVVSWGGASGISAALVAAVASIEAFVMFVAMGLLNMLIFEVFKLFVAMISPELAFIIAIVALAYGAYTGFQAGSIKGAPWAKELLAISTNLTKAIQANIAESMTGLNKEYDEFKLLAAKKSKLLEDNSKLLEQNNYLSPFEFVKETPTDLYNRTIHSGNVGVLSISAISSYVDTALTLPEQVQF